MLMQIFNINEIMVINRSNNLYSHFIKDVTYQRDIKILIMNCASGLSLGIDECLQGQEWTSAIRIGNVCIPFQKPSDYILRIK